MGNIENIDFNEEGIMGGSIANPKNQTCEHSKFPDGLWCSKYDLLALVGVCEGCESYKLKGLGGLEIKK